MTELNRKSILARLLAKENIQVEQCNHPTAFFDVERRILGIPYWKGVSNDLYDLFVGHEVGHALYTPADGWHTSTKEIPGCPRSYINIVEDIRIEKKVLNEYPGLIGSFMRGYKDLLDRDFFGIGQTPVHTMSFMNRLNIHSKTRGQVKVPFSAKEHQYVDMAMAVETWEDVIQVCRELLVFVEKEIKLNLPSVVVTDGGNLPKKVVVVETNTNPDSNEEDLNEREEAKADVKTDDDEDDVSSTVDNSNPIDNDNQENNPESFDDDDQEEEPVVSVGGNNATDPERVETDEIFRDKIANSMVDSVHNGGTLYVKGPSKKDVNSVVVPYEKVAFHRYNYTDYPTSKYQKFLKTIKDPVNVMVKEFEMRKTARRFARAKISTKGSLNMSALHRYKFDDNIFKQVTHFDDDTSHGIVMVIDYSASMRSIISKVIKQLLILVSFCKRVNIPFEVYGFTNPSYNHSLPLHNIFTKVDLRRTHIFKLIDSSMSKATYEEAFKILFAQTVSFSKWHGSMERMQGTPLVSTIIAMYHVIEEFKAKHNVQKMKFITLTDGGSDHLGISYGNDIGKFRANKLVLEILNKKIPCMHNFNTADVLNGLRNMGITTVNFDIMSARSITWRVGINKKLTPEEKQVLLEKVDADGYYTMDDIEGYDRKILLAIQRKAIKAPTAGSTLETPEKDEDEEEGDEFFEGFSDLTKQRKHNRIIAAKFAEMIA